MPLPPRFDLAHEDRALVLDRAIVPDFRQETEDDRVVKLGGDALIERGALGIGADLEDFGNQVLDSPRLFLSLSVIGVLTNAICTTESLSTVYYLSPMYGTSRSTMYGTS